MSPASAGQVAIVTDSTAYLPEELIRRYQIRVVPIHVAIGGVSGDEGSEVKPADVAQALRDRRTDVTTSRATPEDFSVVYRELLDQGAKAVVSIHMSGKLSGTVEAAELAAAPFGAQVTVIDSTSTGMGLGFPVLAGAEAAASKATLAEVREAVERAISRTTIYFYVDTLEFLRRGGRIGAAEALLGTALAVKPILHVADGQVVLKEKVRTAGRALARHEELVLAAAADGEVDVSVHHLDAPERANALAGRLRSQLPRLGTLHTSEVGAAVGAHVGPGVIAAVVYRREDSSRH
ncbi:MAG TPA: DegV family protein [Micromonosporaceae bacterium]|jgi:DegV family protein with EDD domain|nr:DegV family protein [Micromonosporaceae bacterium]